MQRSFSTSKAAFRALWLIALAFSSGALLAQQPGGFAGEREKAVQLSNEKKYAEALPLLEKLSTDKQADGQIFLGIGFAYWNTQDPNVPAKFKPVRLKARVAFLRAKELGVSVPEVDLMIASIKPDGGNKGDSDNPEAQAAMLEAFPMFAAGNYKKAVVAYEKAATLDPSHYEASLYTGNTYYALKDYDKAGIWFAKAITLDPNRETAYRYWADGLFNNGKVNEAVDKYFDAIIAEPYSSSAWRGLIQYGQRKSVKLAHPKIDVPVDFSSSADGNTKITLGNIMGGKDDDGSFAWTMYGMSRAMWQTDKEGKLSKEFAAAYPGEKTYRHSLAEETAAFRSVLLVLKENKKAKKPERSIALLKSVDEAGLIEVYILFARSDDGIKQDYAAYRQNNREKLKRYLAEYVIKNGGN